jgi:hypothetical protein
MGSFSELVLAFDFSAETPDDVLAAFSALTRDVDRGPAPALPEPVIEPQIDWVPDPGYSAPDMYPDAPWRHDWATWLSRSVDVTVTPSAALCWAETGAWNLSCRCAFKSTGFEVHEFIRWISPYIGARYAGRAHLVGYINDENYDRPHLLWAGDGTLALEVIGAPI